MRAVLKQEVVPKKLTRKTSVRASKAVSTKTIAKKVPTKKLRTPVLKKRPAKSIATEQEQTSTREDEAVFVPGAASLRLLEKAELYRVWYKNNFPLEVAKLAFVSGYAFVFLGTVLATAAYLTNKETSDFKAAIVCSEAVCSEVANADLPPTAPLVTFKNSLPENLKSDTDIVIKVENTNDFKVFLKNLATGELTLLTYLESLPEGEYRYLISPQGLSVETYQLIAEVVATDALYKFIGPQFTVEKREAALVDEVEELSSVEPAKTLSTNIFESESDVLDEVSEDTVIEDEEPVPAEGVPLASPEEAEDLEAIEQSLAQAEEPEEEEQTPTLTPIMASVEGKDGSQYLKIQTGQLLPEEVAVYSELATSGQSLYLGLATLVQGEWVFSLSALQLPALNHLLYASFVVDGIPYRSSGVSFSPKYTDAAVADSEISLLVQKVELALLEKGTSQNRTRYFSDLNGTSSSLFDRSSELQFATDELLTTLDEYLVFEAETLDNLFAKYAQVTQVGKKYLIALADRSLTRQASSLSRQIAADISDRTTVPTLQTVLSLRYQIIKELVAEHESALNQETSSLTSRDSDSDGLSDYDELTVYTSSSVNPDSDQDGVIDSVEILTGSDPLVSDVLTVVSLGHISEDITFDEVVSISEIEPLVVRSLESSTDTLYALVHGKSIPNSYVHIVSSSMGTVGVIKTNANGDFSYTLEQALPDQRHEVVAVLSDTAGNIVASSRPHVFTKTQSTFVAAAAGSQNIFFGTDEARVALQFSTITTAIAVVALGLVLLLLSHTLRARKVLAAKTK